MPSIGVALIGTGAIALANHVPGLTLDPRAKLIALCDSDPATLEKASQSTNISATFADYHSCLNHPDVDAVIVATPNFTHAPIVFAAIDAGKHILCEKPLALDYPTAREMVDRAQAAGIVHMTAFTYRFVPAMRYLHHLIQRGDLGTPFHFRAQRFQDWGERGLGWRQIQKLAGSGELADMLSHRIDYAHHLIGPIRRLVADLRNFIPTRGNKPSDVDDWVAILCEFANDPKTTGVLESTKLATGRGEGHRGQDVVEINGSEMSVVYSTQRPLQLLIGKPNDPDLVPIDIPREFQKLPASPRDPTQGDPLVTFRYDQAIEFIDAIANHHPAAPSFLDGAEGQKVMDAALQSAQAQRWIHLTPT